MCYFQPGKDLFRRCVTSLQIYASIIVITGCLQISVHAQDFLNQPNPWPQIRKSRIEKLLPQAMQRADVDAWLTVCRENNNDPLAMFVGGENAGGTAAFIFYQRGDNVSSLAISPGGEATALKDIALHDEVRIIERGASIWEAVAQEFRTTQPKKIAINSSNLTIADGLSHTQLKQLEMALGDDLHRRLVPSAELVIEWLSVKLPQEIEIMRKAAQLTAQWQIEAYKIVVPGVTKDSDVAKFLKKKMATAGVEDAWAPAQNPNINSGIDRGHSHATEKVIKPGDFIQTDFGIKVFGVWCSDIQRFAYVLAAGETAAPAEVLQKWAAGRKGSRTALAAMKPGVRGWDVDKAQRNWMQEAGSLPVRWSTGHPVGYWAHDVGPSLGGAQRGGQARGNGVRMLRPGQTFAFDGFFKWGIEIDGKKVSKTISVEEMAVVTKNGAEYLIPPQEELILIRSE